MKSATLICRGGGACKCLISFYRNRVFDVGSESPRATAINSAITMKLNDYSIQSGLIEKVEEKIPSKCNKLIFNKLIKAV